VRSTFLVPIGWDIASSIEYEANMALYTAITQSFSTISSTIANVFVTSTSYVNNKTGEAIASFVTVLDKGTGLTRYYVYSAAEVINDTIKKIERTVQTITQTVITIIGLGLTVYGIQSVAGSKKRKRGDAIDTDQVIGISAVTAGGLLIFKSS
jgi:hypothetical protein